MFTFANEALAAEMLDPGDDRDRLGPRYCWGGYLHQLRDADGRDLLSGPEYPGRPTAYNGQGAPEVFCYQNYRTKEWMNVEGDIGIILGIGTIETLADGTPTLGEVCEWDREIDGAVCTMSTEQAAHGWAYHLARRWELRGTTAISTTRIESRGDKPLDVLWYPHPFYPLVEGGMDFHINLPIRMDDNPGFEMNGQTISMTPGFDWNTGRLQWLEGDFGGRLEAVFQHPLTGTVTMRGEFPISHLPLWANAHTISLEPYVRYRVPPEEACQWTVAYEFGPQ